jgi:hypothetical protein
MNLSQNSAGAWRQPLSRVGTRLPPTKREGGQGRALGGNALAAFPRARNAATRESGAVPKGCGGASGRAALGEATHTVQVCVRLARPRLQRYA